MEFLGGKVILHAGDCLDVIKTLEDSSVDSIVTDPPYGLEFMGREWDKFAPDRKNASVWDGRRQAQDGWQDKASGRSGKGGGGPSYKSSHKGARRCVVCGKRAFSGTPCECADPQWTIEHRQEAPSAMLGFQAFCEAWAREAYRVLKPGGHLAAFGGTRTFHRLACAIEDAGFEIRDQLAWAYGQGFPKSRDISKAIDEEAGAEREVLGVGAPVKRMIPGADQDKGGWEKNNGREFTPTETAPATEAARQWQGWGTALKPSWEPICLARKPLSEKTVAANILRWGTGALNIDECRIGDAPKGRWPANICHDGSPEVVAMFPDSDGQMAAVGPRNGDKLSINTYGDYGPRPQIEPRGDTGSAARFFYSAKADADDRLGSKHPTVKPVDLMQWLCRLITPNGGTILDPFAGTGTTGAGAYLEGFRAVLIEREAEYQADIARRMALTNAGPVERASASVKASGKAKKPGPLFDWLE